MFQAGRWKQSSEAFSKWCENLRQTNNYFTTFLSGIESCVAVCCMHSVIEHGNILTTNILQGSAATRLRYGWMFNNDFIANLPVSLTVKDFYNSVDIFAK